VSLKKSPDETGSSGDFYFLELIAYHKSMNLIIMVKPAKETITTRAAKSILVMRSSLRVVLGPRA
jgi:hypothetical protein